MQKAVVYSNCSNSWKKICPHSATLCIP